MVPLPSFSSFTELNEYLAAACYADLFRRVRGKAEEKAVRLEQDRAAMLALPAEAFEVRRVEQTSANSLSLVRFDRNDYSVPTYFAHHGVTCLGGIDDLRILCGTDLVATHARSWNKEGVFFDFRHYLALLERKPGALDFARPLEGIQMPECLLTLRRRLEADLGHKGTREFIKVLRLFRARHHPRAHRRRRPGARHRRDGFRRDHLHPRAPCRGARRALQPRRPAAPKRGGG